MAIDEIYNWDYDRIRGLLMGRKVTVAGDDKLVLDNGTVLTVIPNEGCGGCSSGWYQLDGLAGSDNAITDVSFEEAEAPAAEYGETLTIFVYAEHKKINLVSVSGDVGNGYYGSGYRIEIEVPS